MKAKTLPFIFAAVALFTATNFQACKKPADTIAIVTIVDVTNAPVSGATVNLIGVDSDGNPGGRIDVKETTDGSGKATFNFNELYKRGAAGFTVLDVIGTKDTLGGRGIIKVEEEKTNEVTITIEDI